MNSRLLSGSAIKSLIFIFYYSYLYFALTVLVEAQSDVAVLMFLDQQTDVGPGSTSITL